MFLPSIKIFPRQFRNYTDVKVSMILKSVEIIAGKLLYDQTVLLLLSGRYTQSS